MVQQKNGVDSQGVEAEKTKKPLTLAEVEKLVAKDLPTCIAFLQAVLDPDIQKQVSIFLHGKYLNEVHKKELDNQIALDIVKANR